MKKTLSAFQPFVSEITHNFMLAACIIAPILMGFTFRSLLPILEHLLCEKFSVTQIITPYYRIFDILLAIMTPIMFCFAGVLVILEEADCGVERYYAVTPLGKSGYIMARLGIPTLISIFYDILLLCLFTISKLSILMIFALSVSGGLMAVITSLIVVSFAKNKMEGMAIIKLCGLLVIGIPVAYFITNPVQYVFGILPSFWLTKLCMTENFLFFFPTLLTSLLITLLLYGKFKKKLL